MQRRTECLRCGTKLVPLRNWMVCPIHDEKLIKNEIRKARITLGLPPDGPELRDKGVPKLGGTNR